MNIIAWAKPIFISLVCMNTALDAFIGSAYRISIKGLGTVILLGDQQEAMPDADQEQFALLADFLKALAHDGIPTVVNLETMQPTPEYYSEADSRNSMVRNRLSEREIAPNLRAFVATLRESDLSKKIHFSSSDPRRSEIWNITKSKKLQAMVEQALNRDLHHTPQATFLSADRDYEHVLNKYKRFLERSKTGLPRPLYHAVYLKLNERLTQARQAHKTCRAFFHKYSDHTRSFTDQTIQDIIYTYAMQKIGIYAIDFAKHSDQKQKQVIQVVTSSFLDKVQKKFGTQNASSMINAPWVMDLFNAFTHHQAKTAVFYASDSHIHYLTLFLRSLQKDLRDETITFESEFTLANTPLTREQFRKILNLN